METRHLNLKPGDDLRLAIEEISRLEEISGFVSGVIGNLSSVAIQCPGQISPTIIKGDLEIITLNGTFSPNKVHLHLSFSDSDCKVWGGHLEPGSNILKEAEILLSILNTKYSRRKELISSSAPNSRVEFAVMPKCPWSNRLLRSIKLFKSNNYKIIIVDNDKIFESIKERSGVDTFPQLFLDGDFVGGYEEFLLRFRSGELQKYL